jgi:predicted DNA-binding transcriptional regulator AlpA
MSVSNENETPMLTLVHPPSEADAGVGSATELIDEAALAVRLGVSRSTLQSWRYAGRGPRFIKLGRMVRYRTADIDAFLHANTRGQVA